MKSLANVREILFNFFVKKTLSLMNRFVKAVSHLFDRQRLFLTSTRRFSYISYFVICALCNLRLQFT